MKKIEIVYSSCRSKVWVNADDGSNIGRFDTRFGIDIHNTITEQMNGKPQCLYCTHTPPTKEDFDVFCEKMKEIYNVNIDKKRINMIVKFKREEIVRDYEHFIEVFKLDKAASDNLLEVYNYQKCSNFLKIKKILETYQGGLFILESVFFNELPKHYCIKQLDL